MIKLIFYNKHFTNLFYLKNFFNDFVTRFGIFKTKN